MTATVTTIPTLTTPQKVAEYWGTFLTETPREGQVPLIARKDDAPEAFADAVYAAHADFGPDDWRYLMIGHALGAIADSEDADEDTLRDEDYDFENSQYVIYTGWNTAWLASNINRLSYCDEARENLGDFESTSALLVSGMMQEYREVYASILQSCIDATEEEDAEDNEDA